LWGSYLVRGVHCFRVKFFVIVLICRRPITLVEGMRLAALFYFIHLYLTCCGKMFLSSVMVFSGFISIRVCLFGSMLKCRCLFGVRHC
jgi:hypothetical protein